MSLCLSRCSRRQQSWNSNYLVLAITRAWGTISWPVSNFLLYKRSLSGFLVAAESTSSCGTSTHPVLTYVVLWCTIVWPTNYFCSGRDLCLGVSGAAADTSTC